MNTLIRRTARLREAGPQGIGRGSRLVRRFSAFLTGTNTLTNPSFETDLSVWTFSKTAQRVAGGIDGDWCAEVAVADSPNSFTSNASVIISAAEGDVWSVQLWTSGGDPDVFFQYLDAGFGSLGSVGPLPASGSHGGFTRYQLINQTAPVDTAFFQFVVHNQSDADVMLLDAVSLVQEA